MKRRVYNNMWLNTLWPFVASLTTSSLFDSLITSRGLIFIRIAIAHFNLCRTCMLEQEYRLAIFRPYYIVCSQVSRLRWAIVLDISKCRQ